MVISENLAPCVAVNDVLAPKFYMKKKFSKYIHSDLYICFLLYYYLIGKNVFQLLYKCILQNLFWKHQCQRETPKEDKILWIVLCSKHTMFD